MIYTTYASGDVGAAIEVSKAGSPVDVLMGVGGTPEGVIAAAALKCMGGSFQGRLWPRSEAEAQAARAAGYDLRRLLHIPVSALFEAGSVQP